MKQNVGNIDRSIRITLGIIILTAGFYFKSYWGLFGLVPLATATLKWCPAYLPFKLTTK